MNVTLGKDQDPALRQTATDPAGDERHPDLARARDGHRTPESAPSGDTLPVTERVGDWFEDLTAWLSGIGQSLWSGEVWDIQPPSPRELVDRARDGDWWDHEAWILRALARLGLVACVAWSVPLYTLAALGQRSGRALTALLVAGLIWYLT